MQSAFLRRQESPYRLVRRYYHGSFVLGNYLYIDGGEQTITGYSTDGTVSQMILNSTLAIDLSASFSTATKNNSIEILEINKGQYPNLNSVLFWSDEIRQTVYAYGGCWSSLNNPDSIPPPETLWAFVANGSHGTWKDLYQSSNSSFSNLTRPTFGSATSGMVGGFGLGGYESSYSSQKTHGLNDLVPTPGLQFYNYTTKTWYNISGEGYTLDGTSVYAGAIYVPTWGTAGLVAIFGGQTTTNLSGFTDGDRYLSMSNITLFDASSQSWYYQQATGNIPSQRDRFCLVGATGGNKTTFEIFLYSGQAGAGVYDGNPTSMAHNAQRDEVYILTLPAFVWFKANYTSVDPRIYHTCHVVGNQMLSIGGLNPSLDQLPNALNDTDLFWEGIKVFDMTALTWTNYYNSSTAPYFPSKTISDYYGGGLKYPSWSLPAVESLFVDYPANQSNFSQTPLPEATTSHRKDIIGDTVGGIGALLLSIAMFLVVRRRRKKRREREEAKQRLPAEHEEEDRQVPAGLYEAPAHELAELETGQPVPQEVDAVALSNVFELENPTRHDGLDRASIAFELDCHTNRNVSGSRVDILELGNSIRHL